MNTARSAALLAWLRGTAFARLPVECTDDRLRENQNACCGQSRSHHSILKGRQRKGSTPASILKKEIFYTHWAARLALDAISGYRRLPRGA